MRVDLLLVKKNLAPTRTKAQEMIRGSQVYLVRGSEKRLIAKVSEDLTEDSEFEIRQGFATEFVSRAGHKIKGAAEVLNFSVENKVCLDVGVSTGGFSDFLLRSGAQKVIGIDVGQDQTDKKIRSHPNFTLLEKVNARTLSKNEVFQKTKPKEGFDFICVDVSFISVKLIVPELLPILKSSGELLVLIKPQFELGPNALNESGIVKNSGLYLDLESSLTAFAKSHLFQVKKYFPSPIDGKDGNKEFFLFLGKNCG